MSIWVRDWVYRVISPFLAQLKNRIGNMRLDSYNYNRLVETDADNVQRVVREENSASFIIDNVEFGVETPICMITSSRHNKSYMGNNIIFSYTGTYINHVQSMAYQITTTHPNRVQVIKLNDSLYGTHDRLVINVAYDGTMYISLQPNNGIDNQQTKYNISIVGAYGEIVPGVAYDSGDEESEPQFDSDINQFHYINKTKIVDKIGSLEYTDANGDKKLISNKVFYREDITSDNYNGYDKPLIIGGSSITTHNVMVNTVNNTFTVPFDAMINMKVIEGYTADVLGNNLQFIVEPASGISQDDYYNTFGVKYNNDQYKHILHEVAEPLVAKYWGTYEFEFSFFVKAGKPFKLRAVPTSASDSIDGGTFSIVHIEGVKVG